MKTLGHERGSRGNLDSLETLHADVILKARTRSNTHESQPTNTAAAFRQVAEGLREIAAQLEQDVAPLAPPTGRTGSPCVSPFQQWRHHLAYEVERAMRQGVGLEHLPQERVLMALTLTLVRGVCVQAPRLVRGLFAAALQLISPAR
uniref:BH3-interacting domain death agonist n=1 Tax=Salarias fasciatus TaxID=181472 RepID=A0A672HMA6_SALFA